MSSGGDEVRGVMCPKCHQYPVVYDGNYFCQDFENCRWAMSENRGVRNSRIIRAYLNQRRAEAEAKGDQVGVNRMNLYLADL